MNILNFKQESIINTQDIILKKTQKKTKENNIINKSFLKMNNMFII